MSKQRRLFAVLAAIPAFLVLGGEGFAQTYPSRPITLVIPYNAGGVVDLVGRIIAGKMQERLGTSVVVENRTGGGGIVAMDYVRRAAPDGYTLGLFLPSSVTPTFQKAPPFDVMTALQPVAGVYGQVLMFAISKDVPANTLPEFVTHAKANPGKLNGGAVSGPTQLALDMFTKLAGIDMVRVNYNGGNPAAAALASNEIQINVGSLGTLVRHAQAGNAKLIGVMSDRRMPFAPQIPTLPELGFPQMKALLILAIMGPQGLPKPVTDRLAPLIKELVVSPEVEKISNDNGRSLPVDGEELAAMIREEIAFWAEAARLVGFKPQ